MYNKKALTELSDYSASGTLDSSCEGLFILRNSVARGQGSCNKPIGSRDI